ncbi:MAG: rod shape-determining protein MreC [bacterium]|nr:rod shape-determining protein MreC [bacterium]
MKVVPQDLKLLLFLVFTSLFLTLLDSLGTLNFPKSLVQTLTVPVQYGLYQSGNSFKKQSELLFSFRQSAQEFKALKIQLGEMMTENASLRQKLSEEETLVDQYAKLNPQTYDLLPSRVISAGRFITLDKGSDDGIKETWAVVYKDNYLGKIMRVSPKTSEVMLSFDPDSKIAVFSQDPSGRAKGILEGQFGSEILMDKILHQEQIGVGDLVYSEGTEGILPKGLIMGKVVSVDERQNEVFKTAKVEPLFQIIDMDTVFILRSP